MKKQEIYEVSEDQKRIMIKMKEEVIAKNGGGKEFGFNWVLG